MKPVGAVLAANKAEHVPSKRRKLADLAEYAWIGSVVGYSVLRFVIAWGAFSDHGANAWVFGLIDVGTAWPYAKAVAIVVRRIANADWRALPTPLSIAVVTFFAPYGYLWFAAGEMPAGLRMGMIICVSVLAVAATVGVLLQARRLRREARATHEAMVIDVRDEPRRTGVIDDTEGEQVGIEVSKSTEPVAPVVVIDRLEHPGVVIDLGGLETEST